MTDVEKDLENLKNADKELVETVQDHYRELTDLSEKVESYSLKLQALLDFLDSEEKDGKVITKQNGELTWRGILAAMT